MQFMVPGIIALTAMTASFKEASTRLIVDRLYIRSFDECLMAPVGLLSILMGKTLVGAVRGLISSLAFLIVASLIAPRFKIDALFLLALLLTCLVFSFLGVLIAFLAKSHQDLTTFSSLILLPMTFLGATFFSIQMVPTMLRMALYALPLTHSSLCLRASALGEPFPWLSLLALAAFTMTFAFGGWMALKRSSV